MLGVCIEYADACPVRAQDSHPPTRFDTVFATTLNLRRGPARDIVIADKMLRDQLDKHQNAAQSEGASR